MCVQIYSILCRRAFVNDLGIRTMFIYLIVACILPRTFSILNHW
uniref:Uncharacterized protein n=1 Tax=Lepeophtheirus salmonis TaxID=72036 RepID=A0A0K2T3A2_LEPSM